MNDTVFSLTEGATSQPSALPRPLHYAALLTSIYVVFGSLYIVFSTRIAAPAALSAEKMSTFKP